MPYSLTRSSKKTIQSRHMSLGVSNGDALLAFSKGSDMVNPRLLIKKFIKFLALLAFIEKQSSVSQKYFESGADLQKTNQPGGGRGVGKL